MKAFHTIAVPHKDILEGRLTMDVFAADLWEVYQNRGPDEYKDAEQFFRKTYLTEGLKNLLEILEKRLRGEGGDPVIQIQTPFGGGKTHSLIALYHKAIEWGAKVSVIVGTTLGPEDTIWGFLEEQITGKRERFTGKVSPGREAIRRLLEVNQPVLILMDEVLEYVTKAAGVKVEESTLSAQTIAFMQELTEVAGTLGKVCLVVTLPSSIIEHYDAKAEILFQQLQKVAGRVEKIYTPVQEHEITRVIRQRLFSNIDEKKANEIVSGFIDYAEKESILPAETEPSEYRKRFLSSYPFMPEVVDILYHRWGSFPSFQRTRGVLRLLSLVIHSLKDSHRPYISPADFNLSNQEIRRELLKHTGPEYDGIIAADITDSESGSKKVDGSLGNAYRGLKLGTRAATSIFLYSFSGGQKKGATMGEIKRSATTAEHPASVVAEAVEQLKNKLFYLQYQSEKYFFSNQPNLNRILLTKIENVNEKEIKSVERELLKMSIKGGKFKVFTWPENSNDIPDSEDLKLVVLKEKDETLMKQILDNKGSTPRIYRNTLFFLYPMERERAPFVNTLRRKIAYEMIEDDKTLNLSDEQKKEVKKELKKEEENLKDSTRSLYRLTAFAGRDGLKEVDLGIPTYGEEKTLDEELYEKLRSDGEILEKIVPLVLKEKYLVGKDYVFTEQLYQSTLKTPGEPRPVSKEIMERGILDGVRQGLFGLGELENNKPVCHYFKENAQVAFSGKEILIKGEICIKQKKEKDKKDKDEQSPEPKPYKPTQTTITIGVHESAEQSEATTPEYARVRKEIKLKFTMPKGKVADIMRVLNLLQTKFNKIDVEFIATEGSISEQDYEDKIKETFNQLGIDFEED